MALPILLKQTVEKKLTDYCRKKVPLALSNELRIGFKIRGSAVTLFEARPSFADPNKWIEIVVAQFRYNPDTALWNLYCADRNSRWFFYMDHAPSRKIEDLLLEVDRDPTGIFWG